MSRKKKQKPANNFTCEELDALSPDGFNRLCSLLEDELIHAAYHYGVPPMELIESIARRYNEHEGSETCTAVLRKLEGMETPQSSLTPEEQEAARRLLDF